MTITFDKKNNLLIVKFTLIYTFILHTLSFDYRLIK